MEDLSVLDARLCSCPYFFLALPLRCPPPSFGGGGECLNEPLVCALLHGVCFLNIVLWLLLFTLWPSLVWAMECKALSVTLRNPPQTEHSPPKEKGGKRKRQNKLVGSVFGNLWNNLFHVW